MSIKYESQIACTNQKTTKTKVWNGYLQLNSALTIATIAFFKSGKKMPDVKWTKSVEVKGKVKIQDFESYIKDLRHSPNRELMVVSLCWKKESSKDRLEGMKKVARKYTNNGRVGLAKVITGVDLYVCPCSYTILNLLAKHGLYNSNDKKTIDEYLIGCVVWKRNQINHPPIEEWSPIREPCKSLVKNYPFPSYSALVKSSEEDTPNAGLETTNSNPSLKAEVRHVLVSDVSVVTKQSSPTAAILQKEQVVSEFEVGTSTKRMMEEDIDIFLQKKPCCRDDNENIHSVEPNFIPPLPAPQIHPPVLIPKNDFTYIGPSLMREQTHSDAYINSKPEFTYLGPSLMREQTHYDAYINAKPEFTYLGPVVMREQTHSDAYINAKPEFTYLGPSLMREQTHSDAYINAKPEFTYLGPSLMREQTHSDAYINARPEFTYLGPVVMREQAHAREKIRTSDFTYLGPKWNAANQP